MTFSMSELFFLVGLVFLTLFIVTGLLKTNYRFKVEPREQKPYTYYYMTDRTLPLRRQNGRFYYQKMAMDGKEIFIIHPYNENEFLNVYETHLAHAVRLRRSG